MKSRSRLPGLPDLLYVCSDPDREPDCQFEGYWFGSEPEYPACDAYISLEALTAQMNGSGLQSELGVILQRMGITA